MFLRIALLIFLITLFSSNTLHAATWQYQVEVEQPAGKDGKPREAGHAYLWLPPNAHTVSGLLISGRLIIESDFNIDPQIRAACAEAKIGIVYFSPHIDAVFRFWEEGNTAGARWLKALDDLSTRSGHPEVRRVPWITMGHSTAGIFCRNVAYWKPERVAAVLHIKSGNFHVKGHLPPTGSLKGIPLVSLNGQFEMFGPDSGIHPDLGRETQWICALQDLQAFRVQDSEYLMSEYVDLGEDHHYASRELAAYVALFLKKTAQYRLPESIPPGNEPIPPRVLKAESGWLSDPELAAPKFSAAPYAEFQGDKKLALWQYDKEMAEVSAKHHSVMSKHQALETPTITWLNEGDGWSFKVESKFLEKIPEVIGGKVGNTTVGHADTPILYRARNPEPVEQLAPDTFHVWKIARDINVSAFNAGNDAFHETTSWKKIQLQPGKGTAQTIQFPVIPNRKASEFPIKLEASASSKLPVHYEVEYGPVDIKDGQVVLSEIPTNAQFPLDCKITAYQIGRRIEPGVPPAQPVSQTFQILP